jgi:hypothetical protein
MNEKGRGGEILGGNVLICQRDVLLVRFLQSKLNRLTVVMDGRGIKQSVDEF